MQAFYEAVNGFEVVVNRYHGKVREALDAHRKTFCEDFVIEFLPRWKAAPPDYMRNMTDEDSLRDELKVRANKFFSEMLKFDPPLVRLVEKDISPKNVEDPQFINRLRSIMEKRPVPNNIYKFAVCHGRSCTRATGETSLSALDEQAQESLRQG